MQADYTSFVERMISRYEGGYGWSRQDPGGPTKFGVTCYDLAEHRHQRMDSMTVWAPIVRAMPLVEADAIYAAKYATACRFNDLMVGADCVVFDFGVNSGPSRAIKYAQRVVGVTIDGILGSDTLREINHSDPTAFINDLCDFRLSFLRKLGIWSTFGKGWAARVRDLRAYSLNLLNPKAKKATFQTKPHRIPKAFAKAYGDEELRNLAHD